jgi:predicted glutamine amidotransferase
MQEVRKEAWTDEANHPESLGFGWIQESRTLLRKHPTEGDDAVDVLGLLADIPARAIVGHMRGELNGASDSLDLQPFRFQKWVYAQTGSAPHFESCREDLVADIPDHIRRNIQGKTDAEVIFHRLYDLMKKSGALVTARAQAGLVGQAVAATLDEIEQRCHAAGHEGPLTINLVAASERMVVAARLGEPIHYKMYRGIEQPGEEPLFAGHRPKKIQHPHFNGVFLASNLDPKAEGWNELPERHVLWVDQSWEAKTASIDELLTR